VLCRVYVGPLVLGLLLALLTSLRLILHFGPVLFTAQNNIYIHFTDASSRNTSTDLTHPQQVGHLPPYFLRDVSDDGDGDHRSLTSFYDDLLHMFHTRLSEIRPFYS